MRRAVELRLPALTSAFLIVAILTVLLSPTANSTSARPSGDETGIKERSAAVTVAVKATGTRNAHTSGISTIVTPTAASMPLTKQIGQLLIATYQGVTPPQSMLTAIREGKIGSIILMGDNTAGGLQATRGAVNELQLAAQEGTNPGLLIMTDQEGGEVRRLVGPPDYAASEMGQPSVAHSQGMATAELLKQAGVNLDLAPVSDVSRTDGFMTRQQRTFGKSPAIVARAACAFAQALESEGVGYTLKHFPGLGDATENTDNGPVTVSESAADIYADDLPYRTCGSGRLAAVMVSSASYAQLTGKTPAVLSPNIYHSVMKRDRITALTMSDSFESGAIENLSTPALHALNAGLDMVMYPDYESVALTAYRDLLADARAGLLRRSIVEVAAQKVLSFKASLGLTEAKPSPSG